MASSNSTNYVKKLVKILYEKERQIEGLRKALKDNNSSEGKQNRQEQIDPMIRKQLENASGQLKQVSVQMVSMERKMIELSNGLAEEIDKNSQLNEEKVCMKQQNADLEVLLEEKEMAIVEKDSQVRDLKETIERLEGLLQQRVQQGTQWHENLKVIQEGQSKYRFELIKSQTEINENKLEIRKLSSESKMKDNDLRQSKEAIEVLKSKVQNLSVEAQKKASQCQRLKENFVKLTTEYNQLRIEQQTLQDKCVTKESQNTLLNETLKDYEQFAFQISQYIEAAYVKHCCQGMLRSSKKLIREVDNCSTRFQAAFCKLNQIQLWMDGTAEKLEKLIQQGQLPNETLENLSIIAHSFEEKLQLCDLTERIDKEKIEMDKNEELLLDNLQKQCEKSYQRERSKLVELDEVREVLKITKEINRELMDEINGKEYVISECKKLYKKLMGNKESSQLRTLKNLLNIKS